MEMAWRRKRAVDVVTPLWLFLLEASMWQHKSLHHSFSNLNLEKGRAHGWWGRDEKLPTLHSYFFIPSYRHDSTIFSLLKIFPIKNISQLGILVSLDARQLPSLALMLFPS
ncbi:hypothetical protein L1049_001379 [Liquidambar formosana]|uniref:Secreted protein n=1 Tax=Liquidambar formosana TaxID=63359 RepID=A0AAP0NCC6_LIQFO